MGGRSRAPPGTRAGLSPPPHGTSYNRRDDLPAWRADLGPPRGDVMAYLPARPDLGQLRRQAKELLRAARAGDLEALARIRAVSPALILASAQLAVARDYGFASWPRLKTEAERRDILN